MVASQETPVELLRMEALIRRTVGWQVDDLHVFPGDECLVLQGHATCANARRLVEEEAVRLSGLPIDNRITVS